MDALVNYAGIALEEPLDRLEYRDILAASIDRDRWLVVERAVGRIRQIEGNLARAEKHACRLQALLAQTSGARSLSRRRDDIRQRATTTSDSTASTALGARCSRRSSARRSS
jgi:hypothetical protein